MMSLISRHVYSRKVYIASQSLAVCEGLQNTSWAGVIGGIAKYSSIKSRIAKSSSHLTCFVQNFSWGIDTNASGGEQARLLEQLDDAHPLKVILLFVRIFFEVFYIE